MKQYDDEITQMLALSVIPLDEINAKATVDEKLSAFNQAKYLMDWLHSYFKWVDKPKCQGCGNENTDRFENTNGTTEEAALGGNRVEVYNCSGCPSKTRFVRYNNPAKLLETRASLH